MGDLAVKRGDTHDAIIQYRRVLNFNPENARAYIRLGMLLDTIGELDSAATMFENALKYCPHDQKIMRLYARFLEKIGNSEKAEKGY